MAEDTRIKSAAVETIKKSIATPPTPDPWRPPLTLAPELTISTDSTDCPSDWLPAECGGGDQTWHTFCYGPHGPSWRQPHPSNNFGNNSTWNLCSFGM